MIAKQVVHAIGFFVLVSFLVAAPSADAQKVHALLVILGNDADIRTSVEKNESKMQTLLRQVSEDCEVHVTLMKSETEIDGMVKEFTLSNTDSRGIQEEKQGIIKAKQVGQWLRELHPNDDDTVLIYYSGHGSMDAFGTHILNFDPEVTNDFVSRDGIRNVLKDKAGRLKLLITDTCSNRVQAPPTIARRYARVQSRERRYTKNLFLEHRGFLDITAASAGEYAWGNDDIGGYFTVSLLDSFTAEADRDSDRFLSWREVFALTQQKTQKLFNETTFLSSNQRKLNKIGQTTQKPYAYSFPKRRTAGNTRPIPPPATRTTAPAAPEGMVLIPGGTFRMGSEAADAGNNEQPVHTVHVDAFYMDTHEVTNLEYKRFVLANPQWQKTRIPRTLHNGNYLKHWNGNNYPAGKANHPVVNVSWYGAMAYAAWTGKRLPTEAEWEKAARGGLVGKKYPRGDTITPNDANYDRNVNYTTAVGSYAANGYGLYDMAGNVWEWCLDAYDSDFYFNSPARNPLSDVNTISNLDEIVNDYTHVRSLRVLRGGSWNGPARLLRAAFRRGDSPPTSAFSNFGFRCARAVTPSFPERRTAGNTRPIPPPATRTTAPSAPEGMVLIPAGDFQMGSKDADADADEQLVRTVHVDAFYMDMHEVTNLEYKRFVLANPQWQKGRISADLHDGSYLDHWEGNNYPSGKANHPVTYVSWYGAMAYAAWVGKRLPTEAEWEKAARGGRSGLKYPWGNTISSAHANYVSNVGGTTAVGSYAANGYGLYDMAGNVWEWCLDAYDAAFYSESPSSNPLSGVSGSMLANLDEIVDGFTHVKHYRVLRGGSWDDDTRYLRVADRLRNTPTYAFNDAGFRCARAVTPSFPRRRTAGNTPPIPPPATRTTAPAAPEGMVLIPAGAFQMGSKDADADADEQPVHTVYVDAFYMDQYEVTNAQYQRFVLANPEWQKGRIPDAFHNGKYLRRWEGNNYPVGKGDHPVRYVSWYAAIAYSAWAGKRLPTEAEWEKAARGGKSGLKYPWGNTISSARANYGQNVGDTRPVGSYAANGYGLYDMAGNVWEWCLDAYDSDFYFSSPSRNPLSDVNTISNLDLIVNDFTSVKSTRVLRGGGWPHIAQNLRVADRLMRPPTDATTYIGFRCARAVTP